MHKFLLQLLLACLLGSTANATWSIVVVNRRTGEVAVASATCIQRINLTRGLPILRIGKGAGAIQALSGGEAGLVIMFDMFGDDMDSQAVIDAVLAADSSPAQRQIGVVSMLGRPKTFTGTSTGRARGGVAGEFGDYAYAIQGNVITGAAVTREAALTLIATPGDLATKLMAAMETAFLYGGDGRCSCDLNMPSSCGAPPPSFTKTAHVGFMLIGRIGDPEATCTTGNACANAEYFMRLNVTGNEATMSSPDPVLQLRDLYDTWRADRLGRPDGILSQVSGVQSLPADGLSQRSFRIQLHDIDGNPLSSGGAEVLVVPAAGSPVLSSLSAVTDNGDGSYSFSVGAGSTPGDEEFVITADDGFLKATLYPNLKLASDLVPELHAGYQSLSAMQNPSVPLVINLPARAEQRYLLLASLQGSSPGTHFGELTIPLNRPLLHPTLGQFPVAVVTGELGHLDSRGRSEVYFQPDAALALSLVGMRLDWSAIVFGNGRLQATNAAGFDIQP